jgi:uncharacterized protein YcbX
VSIAIAGLFFYPVKSCRGIAAARAEVEHRGLRHDRRWMIVDHQSKFVTQRTDPRLALVDVAIEPDVLVLSAPERPALRVPRGAGEGARRRVRIWRDDVDAVDCGEPAATWTSDWLGRPTSLVFLPDDVERAVNPAYAKAGSLVGFADGYPILLASVASLEDVNARLQEPVPMNRFRPNIVVAGSDAWAEDTWRRIRIGRVALHVAKPCDRCTIPTIDQRTAERGTEPLETLATFRKKDQKVLFGQNCVPEELGEIAVGDTVTIEA